MRCSCFTAEPGIYKQFYKNRSPDGNEFHLHTVSEEYVYNEFCTLNCSKSTGLYDISTKFLTDAFLKIHKTFLVNSSITSNTVPS